RKDGQVYWIRPRYVATDGAERWGEAVVFNLSAIPVQTKPVTIAIKHQKDNERKVEIASHLAAGASEGNVETSGFQMAVGLKEKVLNVDSAGNAKVRLSYDGLRITDEELDSLFKNQFRGLKENAKHMFTDFTLTKRGLLTKPVPDLKSVPGLARPLL